MMCEGKDIPEYLIWNNNRKCQPEEFEDRHCMFRAYSDTNPLKFPNTLTAYSCNWSHLIEEKHVMLVTHPGLGNRYCYAHIEDIKTIVIKKQNANSKNLEWHKLTCIFEHDPITCNYSHSQVNIMHQVFGDDSEQHVISSTVITHDMWNDRANPASLAGGQRIFKDLREDFRTNIIRVFKHIGTVVQQTL